jgi:hypothetical protein
MNQSSQPRIEPGEAAARRTPPFSAYSAAPRTQPGRHQPLVFRVPGSPRTAPNDSACRHPPERRTAAPVASWQALRADPQRLDPPAPGAGLFNTTRPDAVGVGGDPVVPRKCHRNQSAASPSPAPALAPVPAAGRHRTATPMNVRQPAKQARIEPSLNAREPPVRQTELQFPRGAAGQICGSERQRQPPPDCFAITAHAQTVSRAPAHSWSSDRRHEAGPSLA